MTPIVEAGALSLPGDPGRLLGELTTALERQRANYGALLECAERLNELLRTGEGVFGAGGAAAVAAAVDGAAGAEGAGAGAIALAGAAAAGEAVGEGESAVREPGSESPLDAVLARQARALQCVQQEEERIGAIRRQLEGTLGIDGVTVSRLRAALTARSVRGCENAMDRLDREVRAVLAVAERVRAVTDENEAAIRAAMAALRHQMAGVRQGQQAARAYGDTAKGLERPARFVDKRK